MRRARLVLAVAVLSVLPAVPALAHGPNDPPHQRAALGDLKLESGDVIKDFEISNPPLGLGHRAAGAGLPAENEHVNREVAAFLDEVTQRGRKLQ